MARDNPLWGSPHIQGELEKLGIFVSEPTVDFFTVVTATMQSLYVFVVLSHDRRKILGYEITDAPTGEWAAERMVEAFGTESSLTMLLRDQDNGYVERVIGSLRRECLDHMIIFNEGHLHRVLGEYVAYYNESRTHLGIEKDCPVPRAIQFPDEGEIVATPVLGGLHHSYRRRAA
jgi:putative transposase